MFLDNFWCVISNWFFKRDWFKEGVMCGFGFQFDLRFVSIIAVGASAVVLTHLEIIILKTINSDYDRSITVILNKLKICISSILLREVRRLGEHVSLLTSKASLQNINLSISLRDNRKLRVIRRSILIW